MAANERTNEANAANRRPVSSAAVHIVFAMVAANAGTQFAIQAWMSFRFARDVWEIPSSLCVAVIVALDLFAVTYMVFTYLLRGARRRTRAYVWLVFAVGVGAQLFAAELYGAHEGWALPVRIFAALPALFLAASLHGLIIWRNHSASQAPVAKASAPIAAPTVKASVPAPARDRQDVPRPKSIVAPKSGRSGNPNRDKAVSRALAGEDTALIARDLGVTRRAVQIWKQKAQPTAPHPQVNGHEFAPGVAAEAAN